MCCVVIVLVLYWDVSLRTCSSEVIFLGTKPMHVAAEQQQQQEP
jgi:hypothetical protein